MNQVQTTLEKFQSAKTRAELSILLDIKHSQLTYLLYKLTDNQKYKNFAIPKKSGGIRTINSPKDDLKSLQKKVALALEACLTEKERLIGKKNTASHGFLAEKNILTNASPHRNKRYVLNLDLKDFFPTITGKRIRGFLINDKEFRFHPTIATTLAHIASYNGTLPQGSPCSPIISNLIAGILDTHLARLAKAYDCKYTRYADDITFSTTRRVFPHQIAFTNDVTEQKWELGKNLLSTIKQAGFSVNNEKTRMQYKTSRQIVTGLVVNKKINVPSEYRRLARAYVFSLVNKGTFFIKTKTKNIIGSYEEKQTKGTIAQLHGMLGYIHSVESVHRTNQKENPFNYPPTPPLEKGRATGSLAIYRRFLIYTRFYANEKPLIVCEGKTDGVYLSCAAHHYGLNFPQLIQKDSTGKQTLRFQLLKYARQHKKKKHIHLPNYSTVSILGGGSGGGPNLANLIEIYSKEESKFQAPPGKNPVIIVIDNDSGAASIKSKLRSMFKKEIDPTTPFTHVFGNLYIVMISLEGKSQTSIEDLFSPSDLSKGLNGKKFDFTKDADPNTSVGKDHFAYQFIAKNKENIDWSKFRPLLNNICLAMDDFKKSSD